MKDVSLLMNYYFLGELNRELILIPEEDGKAMKIYSSYGQPIARVKSAYDLMKTIQRLFDDSLE